MKRFVNDKGKATILQRYGAEAGALMIQRINRSARRARHSRSYVRRLTSRAMHSRGNRKYIALNRANRFRMKQMSRALRSLKYRYRVVKEASGLTPDKIMAAMEARRHGHVTSTSLVTRPDSAPFPAAYAPFLNTFGAQIFNHLPGVVAGGVLGGPSGAAAAAGAAGMDIARQYVGHTG